jgi:hypothetical protein
VVEPLVDRQPGRCISAEVIRQVLPTMLATRVLRHNFSSGQLPYTRGGLGHFVAIETADEDVWSKREKLLLGVGLPTQFRERKLPHHLQVSGEMHLNVDHELGPLRFKKSESLSKLLLSQVTRGSSTGVA